MTVQRMGHVSDWEDSSSIIKRESFILVVTYDFTKWVEAISLKKAEHKDVIQFIKEKIIPRFGIP